MVYLSPVSDSSTSTASTPFTKIYQDSWAAIPGAYNGDADAWGTKDMNTCCGRVNVRIPTTGVPSGDYLLRAEALALHTAGQLGQAQFYMTCFQITVTGGTAGPTAQTVTFPGAYKATDPGILVDIHSPMKNYVAPGPAVASFGTTKVAGSACTGCESTCKA